MPGFIRSHRCAVNVPLDCGIPCIALKLGRCHCVELPMDLTGAGHNATKLTGCSKRCSGPRQHHAIGSTIKAVLVACNNSEVRAVSTQPAESVHVTDTQLDSADLPSAASQTLQGPMSSGIQAQEGHASPTVHWQHHNLPHHALSCAIRHSAMNWAPWAKPCEVHSVCCPSGLQIMQEVYVHQCPKADQAL